MKSNVGPKAKDPSARRIFNKIVVLMSVFLGDLLGLVKKELDPLGVIFLALSL
jgi:hypothetical protein